MSKSANEKPEASQVITEGSKTIKRGSSKQSPSSRDHRVLASSLTHSPDSDRTTSTSMFAFAKRQRALIEIERRRGDEATYTTPLDRSAPDFKEFLEDFYRNVLFKQRQQLHAERLRHPTTVGRHFDELVVRRKALAYEDFWQRYRYRTDVDRVTAELDEKRSAYFGDKLQKAERLVGVAHSETRRPAAATDPAEAAAEIASNDDPAAAAAAAVNQGQAGGAVQQGSSNGNAAAEKEEERIDTVTRRNAEQEEVEATTAARKERQEDEATKAVKEVLLAAQARVQEMEEETNDDDDDDSEIVSVEEEDDYDVEKEAFVVDQDDDIESVDESNNKEEEEEPEHQDENVQPPSTAVEKGVDSESELPNKDRRVFSKEEADDLRHEDDAEKKSDDGRKCFFCCNFLPSNKPILEDATTISSDSIGGSPR